MVQRIVNEGVPCTISNGNDGAEGVFYAAGASDAVGAIGIGSVNNINSPGVLTSATYDMGDNSTAAGNSTDNTFGYTPATVAEFGTVSLPIWAPAGTAIDGCTPFPDDTPDLSAYLVLVKRGTCTFDIKVGTAMAKGAKNVMIYNNVPGTIKASVTLKNVTVGMVNPDVGGAWAAALAKGQKPVAHFNEKAAVFITSDENPLNGGKMSTFSTFGPSNEAGIKPQVSAPGGNILSTYPTFKGSYAVLSGTSMACPYRRRFHRSLPTS